MCGYFTPGVQISLQHKALAAGCIISFKMTLENGHGQPAETVSRVKFGQEFSPFAEKQDISSDAIVSPDFYLQGVGLCFVSLRSKLQQEEPSPAKTLIRVGYNGVRLGNTPQLFHELLVYIKPDNPQFALNNITCAVTFWGLKLMAEPEDIGDQYTVFKDWSTSGLTSTSRIIINDPAFLKALTVSFEEVPIPPAA